MIFRLTASIAVLVVAVSTAYPHTAHAQARTSPADSALAHQILAELVSIRSVSGSRETLKAAEAIVRRLRTAGYSEPDAFIAASADTLGNVVARLRGKSNAKPLLLIAHLDVVPAPPAGWETDPFVLTERNGWWHARGAGDDKDDVTILTMNLIRWKRSGYVPARDIIVVFTGDEETLSSQIEWFASGAGRRHIGDPSLALNFDGAGGTMFEGRPALLGVQTAEKITVMYELTVRNPGGHSASPRSDNAIYSLARAMSRLEKHRFPITVTRAARLSLERHAPFESDSVAQLMRLAARIPMDSAAAERLTEITQFNSQLRSTCVATRLTAGHASNALAQTATATVNCRLLPGTDTALVRKTLQDVVSDTAVHITEVYPGVTSPESPLDPRVLNAYETVAQRFWPGVVVAPFMTAGATDAAYLRNVGIPVFGTGGIFWPPGSGGAHGKNERVPIRQFYEGLEFTKALIERLVGI